LRVGAPLNIDAVAPVVLSPPLAGGPWVAIYDPQLMGGHRTAIYTVDGQARIPGRFAIDWIRAPATPGQARLGGALDHSQNGFGTDVLAVSDGRIAAAVDDMPDLPDGAVRSAGPLPLEQHSGNYIALDLGGGRFAFYEHLRHRSLIVKAGQRVRAGQKLAELGSSGSTSVGAHLHFHVADANLPLAAEGVPFVFRQFELHGEYASLKALLAGEPWSPARDGRGGVRRGQHPAPVSVLSF
jgi:murein DD-endopeptidase